MRVGKREIAAIVLCLTVIGASVAVIVLPLVDSIPFEIVEQGGSCGILARVEYIITDEQEWETLWIDMHNRRSRVPDLPPVNFTTDTIIAVFQGERVTGGFRITINRIVFNETNFVAYVDERHPGPGEIVTFSLTQPYHIVKISGYPQDLPVEFVYNIIT